MYSLSIIVPTLNEASTLPSTLRSLTGRADCELIVSDGGSTDGTVEVARQYAHHVIGSERGRAHQMNAGARAATGDGLLFLHADTRLPPAALETVRRTLADPAVAGGAFRLRIESPDLRLKLIAGVANLRSRLLGLPYGDQAIFVRRTLFETIGGYAPWPLMEDVDLIRRLHHAGRVVLLPEAVTTSARRWEQEGVAWTTLRNGLLLSGFWIGISPRQLAKWYRPVR